jgi:ClpP class serine protease
MMRLRNVSGAMKNMGIQDVYVTAGDNKVPFDAEGNFTEGFLAEQKEGVLELYDQFTSHVAMWRGMEQSAVIALGANSYTAKKALTNGLVDKQMTLGEFKSYLEELTKGTNMQNPVTSLFSKKPKATQLTKEAEMPDQNVELQAALTVATAEFTAKLETEKAGFNASLASMKAELEAAQASLSAVTKEKEDAKQSSRLAQLTSIFGLTEAPKLAASFATLDDASFALTVGILEARAVKDEANLQAEAGDGGVVVVESEQALSLADLQKQNAERLKAKHTKKTK